MMLAGFSSSVLAGDCSPWHAAIGQPGINYAVYSLASLPNGEIIAGGAFTSAGGVPANRIARWDGATWHALGDGMNGLVLSLQVMPNGDVIAAGSFTMAGGEPADRIARWDGTSWHELGDGLNGHVWDLAVLPDGDLVVAGTFTQAGGVAANRIARWDGSDWHALGDGFDDAVRELAVHDTGSGYLLYAAGTFTTADGNDAKAIAMWDGQSWSALGGGVDGFVRDLQVFDDGDGANLYVAGNILSAGPLPVVGAALWDGSQWQSVSGGMRGEVFAMETLEHDDAPTLYAIAQQQVQGESGIAVMQLDGLWWKRVSPLINSAGAVAAIGAGTGENASLYIGGAFLGDGETAFSRIVRWQGCPDGPSQLHHVPGQYATIQAAIDVAVDGDVVLVAPGTYHEAINYAGKSLIVESEEGAEATIIDASGLETSAVTVDGDAGVGTVLRGFTITGGIGFSTSQGFTGGGVRVSQAALTMDSCIITGTGSEQTWAGGGLEAGTDSDLLVVNTTFAHNAAAIGGGAVVVQNQQARFMDCEFRHNASANGGGININTGANATLLRCRIDQNAVAPWPDAQRAVGGGVLAFNHVHVIVDQCEILHNTSESIGGGVDATDTIVMRDCLFQGNQAQTNDGSGGGAYVRSGWIERCVFKDNVADDAGGGLVLQGGTLLESTFDGNHAWSHGGARVSSGWIERCVFKDNVAEFASGGLTQRGGLLVESTFDGNRAWYGGGAYFGGSTTVSHCLFARNTSFSTSGAVVSEDQTTIGNSHFCENLPYDINDLYNDAGGNTFSDVCEIPADLNGDGVVDVSDLLILLGAWGDCPLAGTASGMVDCAADLNRDGAVDVSDLLMLLANWG